MHSLDPPWKQRRQSPRKSLIFVYFFPMPIHGLPLPRAHLMLHLARCTATSVHNMEKTLKVPARGLGEGTQLVKAFRKIWKQWCLAVTHIHASQALLWLLLGQKENVANSLAGRNPQENPSASHLPKKAPAQLCGPQGRWGWTPHLWLQAGDIPWSSSQHLLSGSPLTPTQDKNLNVQCFHTKALSLERVTTEQHIFAAPHSPLRAPGQGSSPPMEYSYMRQNVFLAHFSF